MNTKEIIKKLNEASAAYYSGTPIMSDKEYDALFDALSAEEQATGIVAPDSPTQKAGTSELVQGLKKVKHEFVALSLDKTKDFQLITKVMTKGLEESHTQKVIVMPKMDGSTCQLTYEGGNLVLAATRGNGEVGSDITFHAPYIANVPLKINFKGKLVVRGEVVMTFDEFDRINAEMPDDSQYKNPRNLATGTINSLTNDDLKARQVKFYAFDLVYCEGQDMKKFDVRFEFLQTLGFVTVSYEIVDKIEWLPLTLDNWTQKVQRGEFAYPLDGLVVALNAVSYAESLPGTGHNPHRYKGFALKWQDDLIQTKLITIEWSPSRTGQLTPVAVFEPVEIAGTIVERASLHNLNFIEEKLGVPYKGQKLWVYKANLIIPQVDSAEKLDGLVNEDDFETE